MKVDILVIIFIACALYVIVRFFSFFDIQSYLVDLRPIINKKV